MSTANPLLQYASNLETQGTGAILKEGCWEDETNADVMWKMLMY